MKNEALLNRSVSLSTEKKSEHFSGLSVLLPTVDEVSSLEKTYTALLESCDTADITEIIVLTCSKTGPESPSKNGLLKKEPRIDAFCRHHV